MNHKDYVEVQCENCDKIILEDDSVHHPGSYDAPEGVFCKQCGYGSDDSAKKGSEE